MCACGEKLKSYEGRKCQVVLGNETHPNYDACLELWMLIDGKNPLCVCPINEIGSCGVPVHLDLYTGNTVNGLKFKVNGSPRRRRLLKHQSDVVVTGLDNSSDVLQVEFKEWVKTTVKKNAIILGDHMVWEGRIPEDYGSYIRENCNTLKWSVEKDGVKVEFEGLTMRTPISPNKRRRLLSRSNSRGC